MKRSNDNEYFGSNSKKFNPARGPPPVNPNNKHNNGHNSFHKYPPNDNMNSGGMFANTLWTTPPPSFNPIMSGIPRYPANVEIPPPIKRDVIPRNNYSPNRNYPPNRELGGNGIQRNSFPPNRDVDDNMLRKNFNPNREVIDHGSIRNSFNRDGGDRKSFTPNRDIGDVMRKSFTGSREGLADGTQRNRFSGDRFHNNRDMGNRYNTSRDGNGMRRGKKIKFNNTPPLNAAKPQSKLPKVKVQSSDEVEKVVDSDANEETPVNIIKKSKRKPMPERYAKKKDWDEKDAIRALQVEKSHKMEKTSTLIIKFPDPELNVEIVKGYSSMIDKVHFQQPSQPRYCFVHLKADADIDAVVKEISEIPFGNSKISVEKKHSRDDDQKDLEPDEIDPYTLYIGNLPPTITIQAMRKMFPGNIRIDIGFAQKMKYTRYAFIKYKTVDEAIESFKKSINMAFSSRSVVVRFRRYRGNVAVPGDKKSKNASKLDDDDLQIIEPDMCEEIEILHDEADERSEANKSVDNNSEELDNKSNVLQIAEMLMKQSATTSDTSDMNAFDGDLGVQIKSEPLDDFYDDYEDDDDDEEDDDDDDDPEEEDDADAAKYGRNSWDRVRFQELNTIEIKPNLDNLNSFNKPSTSTTNKCDEDIDEELFNEMNGPNDLDDFFK